MDIDKFIKKYLREELPTTNTKSDGALAGFSALSTGPVAGISPRLIKQQDDFDFTGIDNGDYNVYREQTQIDKLNGKLTQSGFYSTLQ